MTRTKIMHGRRLGRVAARLADALLPELGGVYVVLRGDLRDALGPCPVISDTLGLTSRPLASVLRPVLARLGTWRGHRPCILIDPAAVAGDVCSRTAGRATRRRAFGEAMLGVVLHELAHVLDFGEAGRREPDAAMIEAGRRELLATLRTGLATADRRREPLWTNHGPSFIRAALHLVHRARRLGWRAQAVDLIDTHARGLSDVLTYLGALGNEPARLEALPLSELAGVPAPAAFTDLFERDRLAWDARIVAARRDDAHHHHTEKPHGWRDSGRGASEAPRLR